MKKGLAYILAFTGLVLLLAHQMVPHCHCPEPEKNAACEPEHEDDNWLGKIFSTDIGANHLETYEIVKAQNPAPQLLGLFITPILPANTAFHSFIPVAQQPDCIPIPILLRGHITSFTLRPPPVS